MMRSRTDISDDNSALGMQRRLPMVRRASVAVLVCFVALSAAPRGQGTRFITEKDLFKFTWIADPQISPDARTVAFVQVTVNEKDNKYESAIYTVDTTGGAAPVRITAGTRDTTPRWSPDGKWIAFVRPDDKDTPQIFLLPMAGGEERALATLPTGGAAAECV